MTQKNIAFHSPLKPVGHPTPSGDRLMARLLVSCLERSGFYVDIATQLRSFLPDPESRSDKAALQQQADQDIDRLTIKWTQYGAPLLWFCYHPYYKAPDLIGPEMCKRFDVPYVTAEASYSKRRRQGIWASTQDAVLASVNVAAVNICFTERDRAGLRDASPSAALARLKPFIDTSIFLPGKVTRDATRLVTVAMMRPGDKMSSYTRLADALKRLLHLPWTLSVVGEGVLLPEVKNLFSEIPPERVQWHGLLGPPEIATLLARSILYVWPGCGEAYGLAYLEAQAAGVPVVGFETAGVPEVVDHGSTGILTPDGNVESYAAAIASLLGNPGKLNQMSVNAVSHVQRHHSLEPASMALQDILQRHIDL
ncbi:MAG: glycosyltransferase family 4 protein [Granulosicoccus sp.]